MSACVFACVRPGMRPARYLTSQWTEFHQTLVDDVVEDTDELIRREGRGVKFKVTSRRVIVWGDIHYSHRCLGVEV